MSVKREPNGRFAKGTGGRPKGAKSRVAMASQNLLDDHAEDLVRKAVELAMAGDTVALRICLDRIIPPARERFLEVSIPTLERGSDAPAAIAAIVTALSRGELTTLEAQKLTSLVGDWCEALEVHENDEIIRLLEREAKQRRN